MKVRWSNEASGNGIVGRRRLDELDPVTEPPPRDGEHVRALVEPGDAVSLGEQLLGDEPRPRRDVEHRAAVARDARHHRAAPARVLTERQRRADPVVGAGAEGGAKSARAWVSALRTLPLPCHASLSWAGDAARRSRAHRHDRAPARRRGAVSAVLAAEPTPGLRAYLCAFEAVDGSRSWLVLDDRGRGGLGAEGRQGRRRDRRALRDRGGVRGRAATSTSSSRSSSPCG